MAGQIASENETQSQEASVGLITASEYLRANPNKEQCGSFILNNDNYSTCKTTNWLVKGDFYWAISPFASGSSDVFGVRSNGDLDGGLARRTYVVLPAITLSSDISLSGSGEAGDPFVLKLG